VGLPFRTPSNPVLVALGLVLAHLAFAALWVLRHDLPTGGRDEFFIVEVVTEIAYRIVGGDWDGIRPYLFANAYYPPLVRLPGIAVLALGGSYSSLVFSGWVWLPFLLVPTWLVGRSLSGTPWGGTAALAVLLAAPGFSDCLHHYESNLGPMAMVACCFWAWSHSDHLRRPRYALVVGLCLGVGLLSDRLGVLPFLLLPLIVSLAVTRSRATLRGLAIAGVGTGITAGWWYLGFLDRFGAELLPQFLRGEIDRSGVLIESGSSALGWWGHYLFLWPDTQLGLVGGSVALTALALGVVGRDRRLAGLLIWVLGGVLLFTLSQKRQVYYTLPLLPLVSVLAGDLVVRISRRGRKAGLGLAVGMVLLAQGPTLLTLKPELADYPPGLRSWLLLNQSPLPDAMLGERHALGRSPESSGLDMAGAITRVQDALDKGPLSLAVFSADNAQVTEHYQVVLGRIGLGSLDLRGLTTHPEGFLGTQDPPDALFFVHRGGENWPDRARLVEAHQSYDQWRPEFEELARLLGGWRSGAQLLEVQALADGEQLSVWRLTP
jgi:hypothetical protein